MLINDVDDACRGGRGRSNDDCRGDDIAHETLDDDNYGGDPSRYSLDTYENGSRTYPRLCCDSRSGEEYVATASV